MAVPYWILDRNHAPTVENGIARVQLTDGRQEKTVILRVEKDARVFLEDNAFADGADVLLRDLIKYWVAERRNSTRGWIPENDVIAKNEVETYHALYEQDRRANRS